MAGSTSPAENLDATGLNFAIVWARFNEHITERLLDGARRTLEEAGAATVDVVDVPGAFELPFACQITLAPPPHPRGPIAEGLDGLGGPKPTTPYHGAVVLGCVIRGETPHFDFVAAECARGVMQVQLDTRVPIAFGVLTTDDEEQALARAGGAHGNKGIDAAQAAIEMAMFAREISAAWSPDR